MNTVTSRTVTLTRNTPTFRIKEPGSAATHGIAMILAALSIPFLLEKALLHQDFRYPLSVLLFMGSMVLLYAASTIYHTVIAEEKITLFLKKSDHIMIYFLIAGSYTPVCLLVLPTGQGIFLCSL
ncbi:MAG: hemolysin III family protein, partial [Ruminococcus flavefaciens]|nr:hemolysin III family protein [Ruminococcus flavefaciens]